MKISQSALQKFQGLLNTVTPQSVNVNCKIDAGSLPREDVGIQIEIPFLLRVLLGDFPSDGIQTSPVDVCIVLDVSGSMNEGLKDNQKGSKLGVCKSAIKELITNFLGDQDTVHLVKYSDSPSVVFSGKKKNTVEMANVDSIKTEGSTNISGALHFAVDLLKESKAPGTKLIAFFSDGNANVGETNVNVFGASLLQKLKEFDADNQIHISSFGVGADYDEKWLQAIARTGKGEYYYLESEERAKEAFEKSLKKYQYQIGSQFNIRANGLNGVSIKSFNQKSDMMSLVQGMKLGGVYCRDLRFIEGVLVYNSQQTFSAQNIEHVNNGQGIPLFSVNWSYIDMKTREPVQASVSYVQSRFANINDLQSQTEQYQKNGERNEFIVQKICSDAAEHQSAFITHVNDCKKDLALQEAKLIESTYSTGLEFDDYGIVEQLYNQSKMQREELEKSGISQSFQKFVSKNNSVALKVTKKEKKCKYEEKYEDDECDDAYGGLF